MKEIRITLRSEDFAAVSKSMIDLGVSFQVEPVEADADEVAPGSASVPRRRPGKRKASRSGRHSGASEGSGSSQLAEGSGAARLRAMVERNRAAAGRPGGEGRETGGEGNGIPGATAPPGESS